MMFVFTTRVWVTFLVAACDRVGLTPFSKRRLHRLVFLSNCLAPLFEATPTSAHIVKYKRGPFYPRIQWELDRLATMGVLDISNLAYIRDEKGWWVNAEYDIGPLAESVVKHCRRVVYGARLEEYLTEVAAGFASLAGESLDEIALKDENYERPGSGGDQFIDFSRTEKNFSLQTAQAFQTVLPSELVPTRKEELFLYMRFLEAVVAKDSPV
jgi:hypothetical protein